MLNRKHSSGKLYVDLQSAAARYLAAAQTKSACLERIASTPQAIWVTDVSAIADLRIKLDGAYANDEIAVVVLYGIPDRDFGGGYSAGGEETEGSYRAYIDKLCDAIAQRRVIAIVEPDAVADMFNGKFGEDRAERRTALLQYACDRLGQLTQTDVYLDCGHSSWPEESCLDRWLRDNNMLDRLTGIAMNVSNFKSTEECLDRARALLHLGSREVVPVVIDCSRNGAPLASDLQGDDLWCNPVGARLGPDPVLSLSNYHARLWVKRPGESDGVHNSGLRAGTFDLGLCLRLCGE
ncbi:endoglucanase [Paraburkholderia sp. WC7.3g]|uniref:glycoside hydrolase family 6 protein n=1 Tax=Paraburkholderia sp. WC7.3g TaxID=2991070 RepID=UPI003D1E960C